MEMSPSVETTPISLLTGFLGSGKTTVLNHFLRDPFLKRAAVVINEFGEVGIDHQIVESSTENLVLLQSGCLCCTVRGDLVQALHGLYDKRERGEIPEFDRVVIETTGLADPIPVIHTLLTDGLLSSEFHLDGVVTTVDAAVGWATLDAQDEAVKQVAVADRLLVTKSDLVAPSALHGLEARLRAINPAAPIVRAHNGIVDPRRVFDAHGYNPSGKSADVERWLKAEAYPKLIEEGHWDDHGHHDGEIHPAHAHGGHDHHDVNRHDDRISSVAYTIDNPIPAALFDVWLETLMLLKGENLLRMKGIVHVEGAPAPFAFHSAQHVFHPPVLIEDWKGDDRRSQIVLIGRDLTDRFLQHTFGFLQAASRPFGKPDDHGHDHEHEDQQDRAALAGGRHAGAPA